MDILTAKEVVKHYVLADEPAFMWGDPGIGKSEVVYQIGQELDLPVINWRANLRDPVDIRGLPSIDEKLKTTVWLKPAEIPFKGTKTPDKCIFFMDEMNTATPAMQAACFGLVLERRVGEHELKPGVRLIGAGNYRSSRAAAQQMPSALANRFAHVDIEPNHEAWIRGYALQHCDPSFVAFIRFRAELLHQMNGADVRAFPSPRTWVKANKFIKLPPKLRQMLIAGLVGEAPASEFEGFLEIYNDLPDIDEILRNPNRARVPDEGNVAARYAVAGAVARAAERNNFEKIWTYAKRLGPEFEVVTMLDAVHRDEALKSTKTYIGFEQAHKDVRL